MRKKKLAQKTLVWLMVIVMGTSNAFSAAASVKDADMAASETENEKTVHKKEQTKRKTATSSDVDYDDETSADEIGDENTEKSTPSNAVKWEETFDLNEMPEIGSSDFTTWFFENIDQEELWEFVLELMEQEDAEDYEPFMKWVKENESRFAKAYTEHTGKEIRLLSLATGDLWAEWSGAKMNWEGNGTESNPYKITSLSELMGLSEAVAQGEDFAGKHFELQTDVDLGSLTLNDGCWNPIGWYKNATDLSGKPKTAFAGTFDGAGNTISGLKFSKIDHDYSYLGLFGWVKNATIKNLTLEADEVSGNDNVALLAGCVEGNSTIYNVTVNGFVYAKSGDAGAIAGEVTGGTQYAVVENCIADDVSINSQGTGSFVGGIVGNAQKADIVDVQVITQDGDSNRIQGKGYVGGVAGRQNKVNIYNSYVSGTIGGNLGKAVGGVTGIYESGNLIVAQFDGEISRTNQGTASHEGTFIGTREARNSFKYGTGKNDNVSFLYAGKEKQAKSVIGSSIQDDNTWTMEAHIGYFTDYQRKYTKVAGTTQEGSGSRYFYEELEDGIQYIITQKLGKDLTTDYAKGEAFKIDHYAPGTQGEPVKGYLVSIPRIDTKNANGTYDNDVATLTAISSTNNSYYRQIDKDRPSAVAPGCTITVATAAKNKDGNRYQMVYDENAEGKVKPPTYTDENGDKQDMTYINGGSYSFVMPESNTELNAEYIKVTTGLVMTPAETEISVTQIRTGDRKNPKITTEVRNKEGDLIAKSINGNQDTSVQVLPVSVHAEHNGAASTADRTVKWSIDNVDLLKFEDGWNEEYTTKDARVIPNIDSQFIQGIINREVKAQADGGYQQAIKNTIYTDSAVVTAATNPSTSVDNKAVTGTCRVDVNFQIQDQTTLRVEGMVLNQTEISFDVVRKLTGDRKNPKEEYAVTGPITLDASLNPSQPFYKNVTWADTEAGKIISLTPNGTNQQSCAVAVLYNASGKDNPAWIQNIINADNTAKNADNGYLKLSGSGTMREKVTATSEDQTHGSVTASCNVTINFRTEDQTVIHPEGVELSKTNLNYDLHYQYAGDVNSSITRKSGFGERDTLSAVVLPDIEKNDGHESYNRSINWRSSDPDALTVENGKLTVNDQAQWIKDALKQAPYRAEKKINITAVTEDSEKAATCEVTLRFAASIIEADRESEAFDIVLTKTGKKTSPTLTWTGADEKRFTAAAYNTAEGIGLQWISEDSALLTVSEDGTVTPVVTDKDGKITAGWINEALKQYPYKAEVNMIIRAAASDGSMADSVPVKLTFSMVDETYSSGGGGSSYSGGGGGSGSYSVKPSGTSSQGRLPANSVTGTWKQNADGKWTFTTNQRSYVNEWAYIFNPYAIDGQSTTDWFRFDSNGFMVTGWYTDAEGYTYYLHAVSDNTLGHMYTGWHWIDDNGDGIAECYYFDPVSGGPEGKLLKGVTTLDGYTVNEKGQWSVDGNVQTKNVQK